MTATLAEDSSAIRPLVVHLADLVSINRRTQHVLVTSTAEEMLNDWLDALALFSLVVIDGKEIAFTQLEPADYALLEDAWLTRVKRLKAYFMWNADKGSRHSDNYTRASKEIREFLRVRPRARVDDFDKAQAYIKEKYLTSDGSLDDKKPATHDLLKRKAERIWRMTGDGEQDSDPNWLRARLYAAMYYENIIGAVRTSDETKTLMVLKAFEFSKSQANRYLVINAFEAAIAISFLDKDTIRSILGDPEKKYDFSVAPVKNWPADVRILRLSFHPGEQQLIFEGVMKEEEKAALLRQLELRQLGDADRRSAVEHLFQQSQCAPFEDMIL